MRRLRALVVVHASLVPPETLDGHTDKEIEEWRTEYDVISNLRKLGLTNEVDRFLTKLHNEVLRGASSGELKKKYQAKPESWAAVLQTLLNLAGGWLFLGLTDRAVEAVQDVVAHRPVDQDPGLELQDPFVES